MVHELGGEPVLVDGRNRREACRRIGITPNHTLLLDGEDLIGYILSANIHRRNLSKGQRAMAVAKICLETKQPVREAAKQSGLKDNRVFYASTILRHAPDLANAVLMGHLSLDNAYQEARIRKGRAETYEARFNALKAAAPDLADLVVEERLGLEEAHVALEERLSRTRREKIGLAESLHTLAQQAYLLEHEAQRKRVAEFVVEERELYRQHNPDAIDEVVHVLEVFAEHASPLLTRINELKAEKENAEKS